MKKEKLQSIVHAVAYKITNNINGKVYLGIAIDGRKRWLRHLSSAKRKPTQAIHFAIKKYGPQSFLFEELGTCNSWKEACSLEIKLIAQYKKDGYQLYNETDGGDGSFGVRRFGVDNPNFGQPMKPHVKAILLSCRRKLTDDQIAEIKNLYSTGEYTQTALARQFNISLTQAHRTIHGSCWGTRKKTDLLTKKNITKEQVISIRELFKTGNYTKTALAKMFNLSAGHVCDIIHRNKWANVK